MMRRLAIEVGSWRCGLSRGTAGSEVARRAEALAAARASGGKSAAFGDQEAVGANAERGMMMEAAPTSAFELPELPVGKCNCAKSVRNWLFAIAHALRLWPPSHLPLLATEA